MFLLTDAKSATGALPSSAPSTPTARRTPKSGSSNAMPARPPSYVDRIWRCIPRNTLIPSVYRVTYADWSSTKEVSDIYYRKGGLVYGMGASCDLWDSSFDERSLFNTHCPSHTKERKVKCDAFPATFLRRSHLTLHSKKHVDSQCLPCDLCGLKFDKRSKGLYTKEKIF